MRISLNHDPCGIQLDPSGCEKRHIAEDHIDKHIFGVENIPAPYIGIDTLILTCRLVHENDKN